MTTRILLVEDEPLVALDVQRQLTALGYTLAGTVRTGSDAIAKALALEPDLILMDVKLEGELDGVEAARRIRSQVPVPILFVTGCTDVETVDRAKRTEPMGYLVKPFERHELWSAIEVALYKHRTEAKLRALERWTAMTLKSLGDGVLTLDLNGAISSINPRACQIVGWTEAEALGRPAEEVFPLVDLASGDPVEPPFRRVLAEGLLIELDEGLGVVSRDGDVIPVGDSAAPLRDERGDVTGVVVVFRDISKQHAAESEVRELEEHLRHTRKLEAVGKLAGGVAHDFNNMLSAIMGFTELAMDLADEGSELREYLGYVSEAATSAAGLTRQLLAFGRRQVLRPTPLDMIRRFEVLVPLLERLIGDHIRLELDVAPDLPPVYFDRAQLEQVLTNLVVNARDAMPTGGAIRVAARAVLVDDSRKAFGVVGAEGDYVQVEVADEGPGVPAALRQQIFEPFFTTKPEGVGSGLGLATVLGIMRQSGGFVTLAPDAPTGGAVFRLYLPVATEVDAPPPEPSVSGLTLGQGTVLVVEDEPLVRQLANDCLALAGYDVLVAPDPNAALAALDAHTGPIDALVTDVEMPHMQGGDLAARVSARHPGSIVVYMSGYAPSTTAATPRGYFLPKPFTPRALAQVVADALAERRG